MLLVAVLFVFYFSSVSKRHVTQLFQCKTQMQYGDLTSMLAKLLNCPHCPQAHTKACARWFILGKTWQWRTNFPQLQCQNSSDRNTKQRANLRIVTWGPILFTQEFFAFPCAMFWDSDGPDASLCHFKHVHYLNQCVCNYIITVILAPHRPLFMCGISS